MNQPKLPIGLCKHGSLSLSSSRILSLDRLACAIGRRRSADQATRPSARSRTPLLALQAPIRQVVREPGGARLQVEVFKANLRRAARHQRLDPSAQHGVTRFSDMTPAEFEESTRTQRAEASFRCHQRLRFFRPRICLRILIGGIVELSPPLKISTTGALEGAHFLATGELVSLSEQQLVDCDHECDPEEAGSCDSGCNGGLMNSAFEYTLKAGGLMKEEEYPYTGTDRGSCKFDKSKIAAKVANFSVVSLDEEQIAANLVKNGPLAVAINAVFMQTYVGGVSCPYICSKRLDHGVLLVGYGAAGYSPIRMKEKPYWIIKNSWERTGERRDSTKSARAVISAV
ncbi:Papain family cysteine protease [Prunus dulcis]|uniref:Papain family cysteine protease n=1 Tax=Prunus dulcis TaxID=3755 RepID=A0A4Y1RYA9_PRUDU|nr:Papain family cysteine protease [Prunus dulcis]